MNKKYLIVMAIFSILCVITTTLVFTNVLNRKFISLSFLFVSLIQATLGLYQKKKEMPYKTTFVIAGILLISGICFLLI